MFVAAFRLLNFSAFAGWGITFIGDASTKAPAGKPTSDKTIRMGVVFPII